MPRDSDATGRLNKQLRDLRNAHHQELHEMRVNLEERSAEVKRLTTLLERRTREATAYRDAAHALAKLLGDDMVKWL